MRRKIMSAALAAVLVTLGVLAGTQLPGAAQSDQAARTARLETLRVLGVDAADSRLPAYVPAEWGRLVTVEKTGPNNYTLFLQADSGEIFLVQLIQNGNYLFLDRYDKGGVALVLKRQP